MKGGPAINNKSIKEEYILVSVLVTLLLAYLACYFVDIRNVFGLRDWMVTNEKIDIPFLWDYLFTEGGPIEILQWFMLGFFALTSSYIAGKLMADRRTQESIFWKLLALLGIIMLMEDAGNLRHFFADRMVLLFRDEMIYRTLTELLYFSLLALIPLVALIKHHQVPFKNKKTAVFLLSGYLFYGIAVIFSGTRDIGFWYQRAGGYLYDATIAMGGEELLSLYQKTNEFLSQVQSISLEYRFMDYLVEESLELIGSTMLWISSLSYLNYISKRVNS